MVAGAVLVAAEQVALPPQESREPSVKVPSAIPRLWSSDHPKLYVLRATLIRAPMRQAIRFATEREECLTFSSARWAACGLAPHGLLASMQPSLNNWLCLGGVLWLAVVSAKAGIAVTNVVANGRVIILKGVSTERGKEPEMLELAAPPRELQFRFGPDRRDGREPIRLRFKLEGYDKNWHELDSAMRFIVRFYDAGGSIIAGHELSASRESPGWQGSIKKSSFTPRQLRVNAPERAARVGIYISSGRTDWTTGTLAVDDVVLHIAHSAENTIETVRLGVNPGDELGHPLGSPQGWAREGSRPEMAQMQWVDGDPAHPVLALIDDDVSSFAAWVTRFPRSIAVKPGDAITVEWREAFSVGRGGAATATYNDLPPGNYWFRVAGVTAAGEPAGVEVSLPVTILTPLYGRLWFWLLLAAGTALSSTWAVRAAMQRRMRLDLERVERQHLLEKERARIARDIHDDLGASLAQIAMLTEVAQEDPGVSESLRAHLGEIFHRAHGAVRNLDEIVWAINPANDTVEHLATYVCKFAQDYLGLAKIRCRLDVPETLSAQSLTSAQRHNLFLATKEALHNAVKHAAASEVTLRLILQDGCLVLTVQDNGKGFAGNSTPGSGRGRANMRERMERAGGTFECQSVPNQGTRVTLRLPRACPAASAETRLNS